MICKDRKIEKNGSVWYVQEFAEGDKHEFNLYDADGDFVCEFEDEQEVNEFIGGIEGCSITA